MDIYEKNIYFSQTVTPNSMSIQVMGIEISATRTAIIAAFLLAGRLSLQCKITFI